MNDYDLINELELNKSAKSTMYAELDASKKMYAEYLLKKRDEILSNPQPIRVKKKTKYRLKDFWEKLKRIIGIKKAIERDFDGIEAYLFDSDDLERDIQER